MIHRTTLRPLAAVATALALVTIGMGCGGGDSSNKVGVTLQEYKVIPNKTEVKAGKVTFEVENTGGTTHEFVVLRADDIASLETKADGSLDEDKLAAPDHIGELEDIHVKAKEPVTFQLAAGKYVLFCNIVQSDAKPAISHFDKGMHTQITVS
jgi:uncharacterized cupredoxin-like copper-binding protein